MKKNDHVMCRRLIEVFTQRNGNQEGSTFSSDFANIIRQLFMGKVGKALGNFLETQVYTFSALRYFLEDYFLYFDLFYDRFICFHHYRLKFP